ncbi:adenosylcobinamide-phosphate synthase CbiB [Rhizobium halophytocola]|uniref:Cobalamin biosynthesis protein CobD n=1 Tax=Rhizobium halophytocola TaxID=735519 RepID=A0ABS4DZL2_9HYPH|nr:adenosylcobinamide-phosphate synthase CbiB [Rhizobium halophytocola]MBP1851122.1 adenosylcobinamide-phosphate synthase [Rhizobium halophytocola]
MLHMLVLLVALLLDRLVGDPDWMWRRIKHPVVLFGAAIDTLDRALNDRKATGHTRRRNGVIAIAGLLAIAILTGLVLHTLFLRLHFVGALLEVVVVTVFLAQKSLADHVGAVALGLRRDGLEGGRLAVAMIVGRDPKTLDEPGVCRAAIESLAENFSDGVVAPALWYAVAGLPGLLAYKMLNTADSMIGHRSDKYRDFGWASARLDDIANWPAARLSLVLVALSALSMGGIRVARRGVAVTLRDHGLHRSPNSGWPEAAFAGVLDLQLAGPRVYGRERVSEPMINAAGHDTATAPDIDRALKLFWLSCTWLATVAGLATLAILL